MSLPVVGTTDLHPSTVAHGALLWWQQEQPFTLQQAIALCGTRHQLEVLLKEGQLRRLLRGVYLWQQVPLTAQVRANALRLVLKPHRYVYGVTAAWLHGLPSLFAAPIPLRSRQLPRQTSRRQSPGSLPPHVDRLDAVAGVRVVPQMDAVLQLALQRARTDYASAVSVLDESLAQLGISHTDLIAYIHTATQHMAATQAQLVRGMVALADSRARTTAETRLRIAWHRGHLPTPIPGYISGQQRLALALPQHRFGLIVQHPDANQRGNPSPWWQVVTLTEAEIHSASLALITQRLEYEFHQHLLEQVS